MKLLAFRITDPDTKDNRILRLAYIHTLSLIMLARIAR